MKIYLVFSGTTDYRDTLFKWLNSGEKVMGYTALRSAGGWRNLTHGLGVIPLDGDVFIFFNEQDALATSEFLRVQCHQHSAPVLSIHADEVTA